MISIRALVFGCWTSHGDQIKDREAGAFVLRCLHCGEVCTPDLTSAPPVGPKHQYPEIGGKPIYQVKRASTRTKIRPFAQGSRRP